MSLLTEYVPYADWRRNYVAMKDDKLLDVLQQFEWTKHQGYVTDAVERVMEHGGDVDDNHIACHDEAWKRGLVASWGLTEGRNS